MYTIQLYVVRLRPAAAAAATALIEQFWVCQCACNFARRKRYGAKNHKQTCLLYVCVCAYGFQSGLAMRAYVSMHAYMYLLTTLLMNRLFRMRIYDKHITNK